VRSLIDGLEPFAVAQLHRDEPDPAAARRSSKLGQRGWQLLAG
jgi:hypothetical protein